MKAQCCLLLIFFDEYHKNVLIRYGVLLYLGIFRNEFNYDYFFVHQMICLTSLSLQLKIPMKIAADNAIASSKEEEPGMNRNGSDAKREGSQDKDKDSKVCTNDSNKAGKLLGPEVPESEKKITPYLDNVSKVS